MSFQAYFDNIEQKTGLAPREFVEPAHARSGSAARRRTRRTLSLIDDLFG